MSEDDVFGAMNSAIRSCDVDKVKEIIGENRSRLHLDSPLGTWLAISAGRGKLPIVMCLVELGADVNLVGGVAKENALSSALSEGHLEIAKYLLVHGSKIDTSGPNQNPLFGSIYNGQKQSVTFLLDSGIDPHVVYRSVTGNLKNALSYAKERGEREIVDLLLKAGCRMPVEGVDKPVWSPKPEEIHQPTLEEKAHQQIIAKLTAEFGPVDPLALQEILPVHDEVHVAINVSFDPTISARS